MPPANDYRYSPLDGPRDRSLRVGDKERDAVGEILRQSHLEGRLDTDELQVRLERCMTAKSYAELDGLIADFPGEPQERERRAPRGRGPWRLAFPLVPLALIAAIFAGAHLAWLAVPVLFLLVARPLMWRAWGGYRGGPWGCGPRRFTRA